MLSHFIILETPVGCEIRGRDLLSINEYDARRNHMRDMGWNEEQISMELGALTAFRRLNEDDGVPRWMAEKLIFDYATPGDFIFHLDRLYVVQKKPAMEI